IAGEQGKKCESETVDILDLRTTVDAEWCFFSSSPSAIKRKRLRGSAHRISLTQSLLILPLFCWLMLIGANHV
uniref:Uncharacterized protein n=1 Tax=Plectus sambesii TaxID=2011161 RepID=A0A914XMS9_9BILA